MDKDLAPQHSKEKQYTPNEAIAMMHRNTANALRSIVRYINEHEPSIEKIIDLLNDAAGEMEAQAIVVSLRDGM